MAARTSPFGAERKLGVLAADRINCTEVLPQETMAQGLLFEYIAGGSTEHMPALRVALLGQTKI